MVPIQNLVGILYYTQNLYLKIRICKKSGNKRGVQI